MPSIVTSRGAVIADRWTALALAEGETPQSVALGAGALLVPLPVFLARRDELLARPDPVGVRLEPADDPAVLAGDLPRLALVAVHFPKFADGRGYSIAYLLRRRLAYAGALRATGEVLRDQVFYLARSGFDEFAPKEGKDPEGLIAALQDFSVTYQPAADGRAPLFRQREAAPS